MYKLLVIVLFLLICGCSPKVYPVQRDTTTSVRTEIRTVYKDTVIYVHVPEGSASSSGRLRDTTDILETSVAVSGVEIKDGAFTHWLRNKSEGWITHAIRLPQKEVTTDMFQKLVYKDVQYVEKELTGWQKTVMRLGYVFLLLAAAAIVFCLLKILKKIGFI